MDYDIPYSDFSEEIYIDANDSDELMQCFSDCGLDELQTLQRYLSYAVQIKMYGCVGGPDQAERLCKAAVKALKPITSPSSHPYDPAWDAQESWVRPNEDYIDLEISVAPQTSYYYNQLAWYKGTTTMSSNNYVSILDCCVNTQAKQAMPARDLGVSTTCAPIPQPKSCLAWNNNPIQEKAMYTETEKKTDFLTNELDNAFCNYDAKLYDKFNIHNVQPKNAKQAREWLAAGGYTIIGEDDARYFTPVWSDPAKPRDDAGFKVAQIALNKSFTDTLRTIKVAEPKDGLEALKAFETANLLPN